MREKVFPPHFEPGSVRYGSPFYSLKNTSPFPWKAVEEMMALPFFCSPSFFPSGYAREGCLLFSAL